MLKYAGNMQLYAKNMQVYPIICKKYAQNMQIERLYKSNMPKICVENMQKYAILYATYAEVHILHISSRRWATLTCDQLPLSGPA